MKHNIIFIVLTAVILVSGFFAMDILQLFNQSTSDETFRSISKGESNAVYLSSERAVIDPMSIISQSEQEIPNEQRDIATAIVSAMSRYNNTTYIAWGKDTPRLYDEWKYGGNDFIYVDKWKYINYGKKSERLLDCIINTKDFSIVYIRFYSEEKHELSSREINRGLEKISIESLDFYPNMNDIALNIESNAKWLREIEADVNYEYKDFYNIGREKISLGSSDYISAYNNMKEFVIQYFSDSELYKFWLSPLDIPNTTVFYDTDVFYENYPWSNENYEHNYQNNGITANPVNYLIEEFMELSSWFHPSYSLKDGRIYQTIQRPIRSDSSSVQMSRQGQWPKDQTGEVANRSD
ncbi:MAG: hypothetical protein K2I82_00820, partial [Ruminococcus sp.]|nr:hypothetical protein [Ruminococcus sp.]